MFHNQSPFNFRFDRSHPEGYTKSTLPIVPGTNQPRFNRWCLMIRWLLPLIACATCTPLDAADPVSKPTPEQIEFFEKKVRPLLVDNCYSCHGAKKQSGGLRLDTSAGIKSGIDGVAVLIAGEPAKSKLIKAVKREGEFPMPPKMPLQAEAVATLTEWVKAGAAVPEDLGSSAGPDPRKHWAFQSIKALTPPAINDPRFPIVNPIDSFVAARLIDKGLSPAVKADRRTLIRRAYIDLLGLPPSAAEIEAFEKDSDPKAWEKMIDELLASPAYGERWGRYWLDLARYADTKGYVFTEDRNYPFAYTYRDYVVRSLNEDKPYDRFILEQLAADLVLPADSTDKRSLAALGFLTLGRRFLNNTQDIIDDRIDVVARSLMGLTVTCARCHDHKFDPIPTADYYSLYGIFASTFEPKELPLIEEIKRTPELIAFEKETEKLEAGYQAEIEKRYRTQLKKLREPAAIADYIRGVIELRNSLERPLQRQLRERELNPLAFSRWQAFLATELKSWSPIYGPLIVLSDIPEKDFPTKAVEIIEKLNKDPKTPINPLVSKALIESKPKVFKDAASAIAAILTVKPVVGPPTDAEADLNRVWGKGGPLDIPATDAEKILDRADQVALAAMKKKIEGFKAASAVAPARAHVLNDQKPPMQPVVFLRGNPNNPGPAVPRQAPAVIAGSTRKPFTDGSGRLELARAITSPTNPLTARVMVNRVWAGHFGYGFVRTPSDFGTRSDPPSHPELLDYLATRFMQDGWSLKKLHKFIMLSATYQESSLVSTETYKLDPENKLISHQNRRRLDFEAMRDSIIKVSCRLDSTIGGKPVNLFSAPFSNRRSIYGLIDRTNFPGTMRAFDVASPDQHAPLRYQTTVAQQALFLMNSPFITEQAKALAARPEVMTAKTPDEKVANLYKFILSRLPSPSEIELAIEFTKEEDPKATFGRWPQLAQVLLLSNAFAFVD
jgi:mono/diheme cytochrome c family protein